MNRASSPAMFAPAKDTDPAVILDAQHEEGWMLGA